MHLLNRILFIKYIPISAAAGTTPSRNRNGGNAEGNNNDVSATSGSATSSPQVQSIANSLDYQAPPE
jgi:hypothetical protein